MKSWAILLVLLAGGLLMGQEGDRPIEPPSVTPSSVTPSSVGPIDPSPAGDNGRILGVIPNNKITPIATEKPLTRSEKFKLAFKDTTDPFTFVLAGFYAGLAQWQNDFAPFGQGAAGYGKRFGAASADQAIGNYMTEAILPSFLHEDPRYFRKGSGTAWQRVSYAVTRTVVTRTDRGSSRFNYSEIAGNAIAAGISNWYYPASERNAAETGEKFAVQVVSDSAFNVLIEFWPDMRRKIFKK